MGATLVERVDMVNFQVLPRPTLLAAEAIARFGGGAVGGPVTGAAGFAAGCRAVAVLGITRSKGALANPTNPLGHG